LEESYGCLEVGSEDPIPIGVGLSLFLVGEAAVMVVMDGLRTLQQGDPWAMAFMG
jgi:hypothetical protein